VNGPNGFFRKFGGNLASGSVDLAVTCTPDPSGVTLRITNNTAGTVPVDVADAYSGLGEVGDPPSRRYGWDAFLAVPNDNWYDLTVTTSDDGDFARQYAGHIENGKPSVSDPGNTPPHHVHAWSG